MGMFREMGGFIRSKLKPGDYDYDDNYDDNIDDSEFDEDDMPYESKKSRTESKFQDTTVITRNTRPRAVAEEPTMMIDLGGGNTCEIVVAKPTCFDDAGDIGDLLKSQCAVSVNLEDVDMPLAQRMIDYLHGVVDALNGDIQNTSNKTFLVAPHNIKIKDQDRMFLDSRGVSVSTPHFTRNTAKAKAAAR